jgi:hypothetical protein
MKRILAGIGILIVLLLAVALALPFLIDANQFRPRLETELTKTLGREVKLGNLKLSIFDGSVAAADLSIADDPAFSHAPFLSAKSLSVGVELQPLIFSRQLNVTRIAIDGPSIALIQSPAGVWNFAGLGGKSAPVPAPASGSPSSTPSISVQSVKITGGQISLKLASEPHGRRGEHDGRRAPERDGTQGPRGPHPQARQWATGADRGARARARPQGLGEILGRRPPVRRQLSECLEDDGIEPLGHRVALESDAAGPFRDDLGDDRLDGGAGVRRLAD